MTTDESGGAGERPPGAADDQTFLGRGRRASLPPLCAICELGCQSVLLIDTGGAPRAWGAPADVGHRLLALVAHPQCARLVGDEALRRIVLAIPANKTVRIEVKA